MKASDLKIDDLMLILYEYSDEQVKFKKIKINPKTNKIVGVYFQDMNSGYGYYSFVKPSYTIRVLMTVDGKDYITAN